MTTTDIPQQTEQRGKKKSEDKPSMADVLLAMGRENYRFIRYAETTYAVARQGPAIAVPLRASGRGGTGSLRQQLTRLYALKTGRAPSQSGLADAIATLDALGSDATAQDVFLRAAPDPEVPGATWYDLGRPDGESLRILPGGGWTVQRPSVIHGPLWRRTRLTPQLTTPVRPEHGWEAALGELRSLLPLTDDTWPQAVGWMLAGLLPDIPRPVAYLTGEQGTGKSTAGRMLLRLLEGLAADLQSMPRDEDDLAVVASAGWVLALDNASKIPGWMSDALCRVVTGATSRKRELFSDDDVALLMYKRPSLLTGISVGAMRGDLAERMLRLALEAIADSERRTERDLWAAYREMHGRVLGGLAELAALVWAELPNAATGMQDRPRMADWAELLWALDRVTGWKSLDAYLGEQDALVEDVLDGDTVGKAVRKWCAAAREHRGTAPGEALAWEGTMSDLYPLLTEVRKGEYDDTWPRTAASLGGRLARVAPALRKRGIDVVRGRTGRQRTVRIAST